MMDEYGTNQPLRQKDPATNLLHAAGRGEALRSEMTSWLFGPLLRYPG